MPDLNHDGIITTEEISYELQDYYNKNDLEKVFKQIINNTTVNNDFKNEINKKIDDLAKLITGDIGFTFDNYYTKEEVNNLIKSISLNTTAYKIPITTDGQNEFDIQDTKDKLVILLLNSTVRTDFSINGTKLVTEFRVPLNATLVILIGEIKNKI